MATNILLSGPACECHTKSEKGLRNLSSTSLLEDQKYMSMLESYVVQLKLVNSILQESKEPAEE